MVKQEPSVRLVESLPLDSEEVRDAAQKLWDDSQNIIVEYKGGKRPLFDVLLRHSLVKKECKEQYDIVVHPDWPWTGGVAQIQGRVEDLVQYTNIQGAPDMIADIWREQFQRRITDVLEKPTKKVIITTPESPQSKRFETPGVKQIPSAPLQKGATGFLTAQGIATLLEITEMTRDDTILFHGATYGCCPSKAAEQLLLALHCALFIEHPGDTSAKGRSRHASEVMGNADVDQIIAESKIRYGTLMDCQGIYQHFRDYSPHKNFKGNETLVLPDQDNLLMRGAIC